MVAAACTWYLPKKLVTPLLHLDPCVWDRLAAGERQGASPMPSTLGPLGAFFVSGAAQADWFSDWNTGRLAPCRYKVAGIRR